MLSRAVIRSIYSYKLVRLQTYPASLRIYCSRVWCRAVTSSNRPNASMKETVKANRCAEIGEAARNTKNVPLTESAPNSADGGKLAEENQETRHERNNARAFSSYNNISQPSSMPTPGEVQSHAPSYPLPDLTQGIPSTIEYEATGKSSVLPLDLMQAEQLGHDAGVHSRGSLPASAYVTSSERKRLQVANYMYGLIFIFSMTGTLYLGRNWDNKDEEDAHPQAPSGWAIGLMWKRAKARASDKLNYYQEPAFKKLLPDVEPMFERPYTLVLGLEDLLICTEWSREHGWRLAKRPGVDYFLRYLSQYFELVVFTTQPSHLAEPIIRKLDPYHIIMWPLFREATLYENGEYIKDLSYLNRDLSKVILLDINKAHAKKQPENAIIINPWHGDPRDKELVSLIPFLEYIHTMAYSDVRKAIKSFEGKHIPTEFARREVIARKKFLEQLELEKKKRPKRSAVGILVNALGIKYQPMMMDPNDQSPAEAFAQGKMLQDQARERGQRNYELLEKEIRENGEKWLKEEAELEEKSKEESMKAMKSGLMGWFGGEKASEPKN